jgi:hypothetical protein
VNGRKVADEEVAALFDFAVAHPEGVTRQQIANELHCGCRRVDDVIRALRLVFADDSINLVGQPNGRGPWLYFLRGTVDEVRPWIAREFAYGESFLGTMRAVLTSIDNAVDGRKVDGRTVRIWRRTVTRALEDLADL